MYNDQLYADGVHSVLRADWELVCSTPLAIRNGHQLAYADHAPTKTRYRDLQLNWRGKEGKEFEVAALHYGYEIRNGQVLSYHLVPPGSVRGALRSWSIRHLVHPTLYPALSPIFKEDTSGIAARQSSVQRGLARRDTGCELIASLFGLAADEGETATPSNAGRLHIETERFCGTGFRPVDVSGVSMIPAEGPDNVCREMAVRTPLDRMTHASHDTGLHRFLEVARGEAFKVRLRIINPLDCDLGLLGLWVRELNAGMLRIGALASIGRGRMEVRQQTYELWRRANAPLLQGYTHLGAEADGNRQNDILAGLWKCYPIAPEALLKFTAYLKEFTGGSPDVSLS
jgi:hypothetical protein